LYQYIRSHGTWENFYVRLDSVHDTYEDARLNKVCGTLNVYTNDTLDVFTIYKIYCRDPRITATYIGQTNNFNSRRDSHCVASMYRNLKLYNFINLNGGWPNWKMIRVRDYPYCRDREELNHLEFYWWNKFGSELNTKTPGYTYYIEKFKDDLNSKMSEFEQMVVDNVMPRENFFINSVSIDI